MQREFKLCRLCLIAVGLACAGAFPLLAQDEDPFTPAEPSPAALQELRSNSPLAAEPRTPVELLDAVVTMVDIGRTDLAVQYLDQLSRKPLDEATLLELRDQFGTATLLKLDQVPELRSMLAPILEQSDAALLNRAGRADRIADMVQALRGSREERSAALSELRGLGPLAVPTLIGMVASNDDARLRGDVGGVLIGIGSATVPMLLGTLESPDPRVQEFAVDILGRLRATAAVPDLYYFAFSPNVSPELRKSAQYALQRITGGDRKPNGRAMAPLSNDALARRLSQAATDFLRQKTAFETDPEGFVADWSWNDDPKTIALRRVTPEQAATRAGSRHAARALEVSPSDPRARVLDLAFGLARETRLNTIFQPLPAGEGTSAGDARAAGPAVLNDVLREALTAKRPEIAATAARLLGELKDPVALTQSGERTAPLMMALDHPDLRVQFAATQAILQIGPKIPYRGGRRVVEVLKQAIQSNSGRPHAIIGEVSSERAGEISGMLKELGFETLVALSGKEVFRAAADRTDVELILVHPNIIRWPLSETLSNLRTDARTARVPVVVYGPSRLQERFRSPTPGQTKVTYAALSETPADLAFQIQPVLDRMRREAPTAQQQTLMRKEAIEALGQLANTGNSRLYNLVGTEEALAWAAAEPTFSLSALESLGRIGTRQAQNLIAEFILNSPVNATTKRAREILDAHVARNGLLLKQAVVSELHAGTGVTLIKPED